MRLFILMYVILLAGSCKQKTTEYNINDFGAKGDGLTINTQFINAAIEECHKNGGGTVLVPAGNYIVGTIRLLSNINLHLESGARLSGSKDTSDYLPMVAKLFNEGYNRYGMIYAADAVNISITGIGEINGNGTHFMNGIDKPHKGRDWNRQFTRQGDAYMREGDIFEDGPVSYKFRPGMLLTIERCENIQVTGVSLNDTPEWTVRLQDCDGAVFNGITIRTNPLIPNSDGIHCTSSRNIRISDCNIFAGDDAIVVTGFGDGIMPGQAYDSSKFKGNKTGYAENVVVTNCILSSRSSCIRVGYGQHPIRNLI
ncbi:MAG: glycoside hydrolase family 28 protein, partial [Chitinophagaceae bacterium]